MKRLAGFLLAFTLLTGTAAGCSDDDDGDNTATEADGGSTDSGDSNDSGDSGDSGSSSSNPDVVAYCEAVTDYVTRAKEAIEGNDMAALTELGSEAADLSTKAAALTDITAEEAEEVAACSQEAADIAEELTASIN